jgi:hypothetical protein
LDGGYSQKIWTVAWNEGVECTREGHFFLSLKFLALWLKYYRREKWEPPYVAIADSSLALPEWVRNISSSPGGCATCSA